MEVQEEVVADSSGAACPGLIEATDDGKQTRPLHPHPGLLAPASLKRTNRHDGFHHCHTHPGLLAPASLKHWLTGNEPALIPDSSGAACPGLIEAVQVLQAVKAAMLLIRGCLPRPH